MLVYIFGLSGNILGILVLSTCKILDKLGPKDTYTYLFLADSVYLSQLVINYLQFGWGYDATIQSSTACKLYEYFQYSTDAFSPFLIAYISVERLVSFKYPSHKEFLTNRRNQFIYFFVVVAYNCFLYSSFYFFTDVQNMSPNSTEPVLDCTFVSYESMLVLNYLDIANKDLLPFLIIIINY